MRRMAAVGIAPMLGNLLSLPMHKCRGFLEDLVSCRRCTPTTLCATCAALLIRAEGLQAPAMTHAQLQQQVRLVCKQLGLLHFHIRRPRTKEEEGLPDSLVCAPAEHPLAGTLYVAELKTVGDRPTLMQQRWLDALACVERVETALVYPADLEGWVHRLRPSEGRQPGCGRQRLTPP